MTAEKVLEAIAIYRRYFKDEGIGKVDFPHDVPTEGFADRLTILEHCHGMLEPMEAMIANGTPEKMEKVFRWVGFIQGCLWSQGLFCLDDLKNHNRS